MALDPVNVSVSPARRSPRTVILAVCVICAFLVTHRPPPDTPSPPLFNDKLLHFVGFAVLGMLAVWRQGEWSRTISWRALSIWYVGLASYAAMDEATQPWVGRSCEFLDWLADGAGGMVGMAMAWVCGRMTLLRESGGPGSAGE